MSFVLSHPVEDPCSTKFEWDCYRPHRNGNFEDLQTGQHGQQGQNYQWQQWQSALLRSVCVCGWVVRTHFVQNWTDRNSCLWKQATDSCVNVLTHVLYIHPVSFRTEHQSHHVTQIHPLEGPAPSKFSWWGNNKGSGSVCNVAAVFKKCTSMVGK